MNKPTLYILTGLPFSGKTSLTRKLVKRFGFKVASMDEIMSEKGLTPDTMSQDDWNDVYAQGYNSLKRSLSEGFSVVLDCGNLKRSERETAQRIAEGVGVSCKLIYLNISKEEAKKRWKENRKAKFRDDLTDMTMKTALNMFEEPVLEERPIVYNQNMDLENWIQENIA